ncbi:MAG: class I SAM-dependent methyltransferase [Actinomycetota bacterium]
MSYYADLKGRAKLAYYRNREKIWALYPKLSERIEEYYHELIINEGRAAGIDESSRVLLIGAGATPYTAVTLAREFGCHVTGIDKDLIAVLLARLYLRRKAPQLDIKMRYGNGLSFKVDDFDVIVIVLHAKPKERILRAISESSTRNLTVILRNPRGKYVHMYEEMKTSLSDIKFILRTTLKHPEPYRFNTLILEKYGSQIYR